MRGDKFVREFDRDETVDVDFEGTMGAGAVPDFSRFSIIYWFAFSETVHFFRMSSSEPFFFIDPTRDTESYSLSRASSCPFISVKVR